MNLVIPHPIMEKFDELLQLCDEHPLNIPVPEVARFLGMSPASLRCALEQGRCRFGFAWKANIPGNHAYKVPTLAFFLWCLPVNPFDIIQMQSMHDGRES
ncbi:hypothetical protein [Anaerotruncus rubiinfantis]|uniref:hypothetical protein n=1 Tax=Anaerotruncus rubiinfantis TaxID=1720200 RepID=UPI0034A3724D